MKKAVVIFLLLLFSLNVLNAQDKYIIYFKDKGKLSEKTLSKSADREIIAQNTLSKRSIERRKKNLGENYFSYEDLPLEEQYINKIKNSGVEIHNKLKWFNAVSAYLNEGQLSYLKSQSFVDRIERVRNIKSSKPLDDNTTSQQKINKSSSIYTYDYGSTLTQNELSDIPAVHDMGITGEGVVIGLLDTGFDWKTHVSLNERKVIAEYDFIYNDSITANETTGDSRSQHNHGTSVFSILAGFEEGNLIGPAFNSEFILAKTEFVPTETHTEEDNYAAALEWMDSI